MHILLTNDDGISSPLLHALSRAGAARGHRMTVSAPSTQQSAKSHAFTLSTPLVVHRADVEGAEAAYAVDGTPVDSCRLGMMQLADAPVDVVLSGINKGYNAGLAVFVSGTVGAAREAAFQQRPAMALSLEPGTPKETIAFFADYAIRLAEKLVHYPAPELSVCNVNIPPVPLEDLQETVVCGLNRTVYQDDYQFAVNPRGLKAYWLCYETPNTNPLPGSDMDWLSKGHVTITFLTPEGCNQSDYADFPLPLHEQ